MATISVSVNSVLGTGFGHAQFVFDPDSILGNGDETEIEVQGPFLGIGDWIVEPLQPYDIPSGGFIAATGIVGPTMDPDSVWTVLGNARAFFATQTIDYRLGVIGSLEGQNSNTYIVTLAHIAGLDLGGFFDTLEATGTADLPGAGRNVLFDHHAEDGTRLAPVALELDGSTGDDTLQGGNGDDLLRGLAGNDVLRGFGGRDDLDGGTGDDEIQGDDGRDRIRGEAGDDILRGGLGADFLSGGGNDDAMFGDGGRDRLLGGAGNDSLTGARGDDVLKGQGGADVLTAGLGDDTLTGGGGRDTFVFDGTLDEGQNVITDFTDGLDLIRVEGIGFAEIAISGTTDALISLDGLTQIVLTGIAAADVDLSDFLLV